MPWQFKRWPALDGGRKILIFPKQAFFNGLVTFPEWLFYIIWEIAASQNVDWVVSYI